MCIEMKFFPCLQRCINPHEHPICPKILIVYQLIHVIFYEDALGSQDDEELAEAKDLVVLYAFSERPFYK